MSSKPVISFQNVTKTYKLFKSDKRRLLSLFYGNPKYYTEKKANQDLSFTINRGEAVAVLGSNGAGKSTMLKIITGVVYPTSGVAEVNGRVSALLELTAGFDPEFTGRENIRLRGHLLGLKNQQITEIEQDIIDFAEIEEYIDQPTRTYSSGMRARLGFAINANINPEILVIDEALSVGDIKFQEKCRIKIDEIKSKKHVTVLLVTHSMDAAKSFCSRGLVLNKGQLIYDGPIDDAITTYKNTLK